MLSPEETLTFLGQTLADFARAHGKHPQALRDTYRRRMRLGEDLALPAPLRRTDDPVDGTVKFTLPAGAFRDRPLETESVIIPMTSFHDKRWHTLCLSSQVGCRMACAFCETARMGLLTHLSPGHIVQQRLVARSLRHQAMDAADGPPLPAPQASYFSDGIQNIVFMGMGEPLDNLPNVLQALRVLSDPHGLNFPLAQITVSTVGRVDGLNALAALCQIEPGGGWRNLRIAISLNAATDSLRDTLMPVNKAMPLADLKRTLLAYPLPPKGRFLIEYVLIKDVNDSPADAAAVADFCRGLPCVVNLIPYNPQRDATFQTPAEAAVLAFMTRLKALGIFTKRRTTHGRDLMSACGQLGNPDLRRTARPQPPALLPVLPTPH
jgi:23S rRNA (adenine2503-C2)-methyltransferase